MNAANDYFKNYVESMRFVSDEFKALMLRIHGLSRRKRERLLQLAREEHARLEWSPEKDFDIWRASEKAQGNGWFVVMGIAGNHSVIPSSLLNDEVAARALRLVAALEQAESANDVASIPE